MWSNNENFNNTIEILLFFVAINFMHIGQLFLPIICIIIFIGDGYKFIIKNKISFVILCLFATSFFLFSFKQGFYSTMGFCLPMAYYIGGSIKKNDENSIKKIIYILVFGMACHIMLNFIADIFIDGINFLNSINHYDIWTGGYIPTTSTATNCVLIFSMIYYLLIYEENKIYKTIGIILFVISFIYDIALGRRSLIVMFFISIIMSIIIDIGTNNKPKNKKPLIISFLIVIFIIVILSFLYEYKIFKLDVIINNLGIVKKFREYGFDSGRFDIFIKAIKIMPQHLWGGMQIHNNLGIQVHDMWMDTYDYAGIIPFVLLILHSILFIKSFYHIMKNDYSRNFKMLLFVMFLLILLQLLLEPIMTGSSLFIIVVIIIEALLEKTIC